MAVLTAVASRPVVRSAVTPDAGGNVESSVSPPAPPPSPRLTRVILPRKKPQKWSTGTAPGEYGGPPTTTKLRKYWGGGDVDPVAATDDFIWNKEFVGHMKRLLGDVPSSPNPLPSPVANVLFLVRNLPINLSPFLIGFFQVQKMQVEQSSGFLCLNRAMSLDSVEIDLSKELGTPPRPVLEQQVEAARRGCSTAESPSGASSPRWRLVPTRREQAKWERADKVATGGSDVIIRESTRNRGDPRIMAAISKEEYLKLKKKLQILTLGIGGIGIISAYVSYNPAIAASFGAGLLGSLIYIRMLGNTIDSMADGAKGLVKGAAGQPRLLVPVALVMIYNRWNEILVPDYGFMHLELIPMLVGFFTYKVATFVQAIQDSITVVEERS